MKLWDILDCKMGVLCHARPGEDYTAVLKRRRVFACAMTLLGLFGLALYFLCISSGSLPQFSKGFYAGVCIGVEIGSFVLHWRLSYLKRHATARQRAQIEETDEREHTVILLACRFAALLAIFLGAAALLVLAVVDLHAFAAVLVMVAVLCLAFLSGYLYYSRIM